MDQDLQFGIQAGAGAPDSPAAGIAALHAEQHTGSLDAFVSDLETSASALCGKQTLCSARLQNLLAARSRHISSIDLADANGILLADKLLQAGTLQLYAQAIRGFWNETPRSESSIDSGVSSSSAGVKDFSGSDSAAYAHCVAKPNDALEAIGCQVTGAESDSDGSTCNEDWNSSADPDVHAHYVGMLDEMAQLLRRLAKAATAAHFAHQDMQRRYVMCDAAVNMGIQLLRALRDSDLLEGIAAALVRLANLQQQQLQLQQGPNEQQRQHAVQQPSPACPSASAGQDQHLAGPACPAQPDPPAGLGRILDDLVRTVAVLHYNCAPSLTYCAEALLRANHALLVGTTPKELEAWAGEHVREQLRRPCTQLLVAVYVLHGLHQQAASSVDATGHDSFDMQAAAEAAAAAFGLPGWGVPLVAALRPAHERLAEGLNDAIWVWRDLMPVQRPYDPTEAFAVCAHMLAAICLHHQQQQQPCAVAQEGAGAEGGNAMAATAAAAAAEPGDAGIPGMPPDQRGHVASCLLCALSRAYDVLPEEEATEHGTQHLARAAVAVLHALVDGALGKASALKNEIGQVLRWDPAMRLEGPDAASEAASPVLAAAIAEGLVPALERLLRSACHQDPAALATMHPYLAGWASLLRHAPAAQVAPLVVTLRKAVQGLLEASLGTGEGRAPTALACNLYEVRSLLHGPLYNTLMATERQQQLQAAGADTRGSDPAQAPLLLSLCLSQWLPLLCGHLMERLCAPPAQLLAAFVEQPMAVPLAHVPGTIHLYSMLCEVLKWVRIVAQQCTLARAAVDAAIAASLPASAVGSAGGSSSNNDDDGGPASDTSTQATPGGIQQRPEPSSPAAHAAARQEPPAAGTAAAQAVAQAQAALCSWLRLLTCDMRALDLVLASLALKGYFLAEGRGYHLGQSLECEILDALEALAEADPLVVYESLSLRGPVDRHRPWLANVPLIGTLRHVREQIRLEGLPANFAKYRVGYERLRIVLLSAGSEGEENARTTAKRVVLAPPGAEVPERLAEVAPALPAPCEAEALLQAATCSNRRCAGMQGPSEACAPLPCACEWCGKVRYCCQACADQHWDGEHEWDCGYE